MLAFRLLIMIMYKTQILQAETFNSPIYVQAPCCNSFCHLARHVWVTIAQHFDELCCSKRFFATMSTIYGVLHGLSEDVSNNVCARTGCSRRCEPMSAHQPRAGRRQRSEEPCASRTLCGDGFASWRRSLRRSVRSSSHWQQCFALPPPTHV